MLASACVCPGSASWDGYLLKMKAGAPGTGDFLVGLGPKPRPSSTQTTSLHGDSNTWPLRKRS